MRSLASARRLPPVLNATHQLVSAVAMRIRGGGPLPEIHATAPLEPTPVDEYWGTHTVNSKPFASAEESEQYLEWRFDEYPLFREFMGLWGRHDGQVVLDYGCGPGDDLVGFLLYAKARRVIGIDVSRKALELTRRRIALHGLDPARVQLIRSWDAAATLPLPDCSVDYVNCGGVLHHTTNPSAILSEFARVLRPEGEARVMVYNRDSIWFHLYTAYVRMILEGAFIGLAVEQAFARSTDGEACPLSRAYDHREFTAMAEAAGFECEFVGGYLSRHEVRCLRDFSAAAQADDRLDLRHREFFAELVLDDAGLPLYRGKHAGIGGVYRLRPVAGRTSQ